jgi:hypothetical protein
MNLRGPDEVRGLAYRTGPQKVAGRMTRTVDLDPTPPDLVPDPWVLRILKGT